MTDRRPARGQPLPEDEIQFLRSLRDEATKINRVQALFARGWTLRAIGEAFDPPVPRSTVNGWVNQPAPDITNKTIMWRPLPTPTYATPAEYERKRPPSPGIPPDDLQNIKVLAPLARKFRSSHPEAHPAYQANQALTLTCQALYADNVSIQELADAAGVSHRAMSKRVRGV